MTNYLLDTNHASPLVTFDHPLRRRLLVAINAGHTFALTTVTIAELIYGFGLLPRAAKNRQEWDRLRSSFRIVVIDEQDALESAEMRIRLRHRGWQLSTVDALIAAIALRYDFTLLTSDADFDVVPELKHTNWLAP